jgi:hypothetical protein
MAVCCSCLRLSGREVGALQFRGRFVHPDYGFSIVIPRNFSGQPYPAEYPLHGCKIEGRDKTWYIIAEAHYFDPDISQPLDAELSSQEKYLESIGGSMTRGPYNVIVDGLKGRAANFELADRKSGNTLVHEKIFALRPDSNIIYSIGLVSKKSTLLIGEAILKTIVASFKVQEIR